MRLGTSSHSAHVQVDRIWFGQVVFGFASVEAVSQDNIRFLHLYQANPGWDQHKVA